MKQEGFVLIIYRWLDLTTVTGKVISGNHSMTYNIRAKSDYPKALTRKFSWLVLRG